MYAADIDSVRAELLDWTENPEPVAPAFCVGSVDLNDIDLIAPELIASEVDAPEVIGLQRTFAVYTQTINSGRAEETFGILGPGITTNNTPEAWAEGQETSVLWDWRIRQITRTSSGLGVRSTFTSTQEAEFGFDGSSTCTRWDLTHDLILREFLGREFWLINQSRLTPEAPPIDCADWTPTRVRRQRIDAPAVGESVVMTDVLAAGTIDEYVLRLPSIGDDSLGGDYEVTLEAINGAFDPILAIVDTGNVIGRPQPSEAFGVTDQMRFVSEGAGNIRLDVRDLSDAVSGNYSLTVRHLSPDAEPEVADPADEDDG